MAENTPEACDEGMCQMDRCPTCQGIIWNDYCQHAPACACKHDLPPVPGIVMGPGGNPHYMERLRYAPFNKELLKPEYAALKDHLGWDVQENAPMW